MKKSMEWYSRQSLLLFGTFQIELDNITSSGFYYETFFFPKKKGKKQARNKKYRMVSIVYDRHLIGV